jgi:AraC-like DNA-binding protein
MHARQFLESYLDAWNHHSPKGVADHLARNGIYCDIPEHAERSQAELIGSLNEFFQRYRHHYELVGDVLTSRDAIAFQYRMVPLRGVNRNTYHGAEFITLSDDGALLIKDYYDVPGTGGELPVSGAAGPRQRKYAKSGLSRESMLAYKRRLDETMRLGRAYLQPDLTLPQLAERVGCTVNHLSQVINEGCGSSFFDYVNSHRIAHARELLGNDDSGCQAIVNVAYSVGFKSNSAFYAAFKKHVGETPGRFRRNRRARS